MALDAKLLSHPSGASVRELPSWLVLSVLCGVAFTSNVIVSLIAPFLPRHFKEIGVSQIWCGAIFSGFPVAMLVCSPLAVSAMARVGRVPVLFFGLVVQGVTSILFGYSDNLTGGPGVNPSAAVALYTMTRLACGAGGACANNAIFSIAADRFPDTLGQVMGLNEVVIGLGFTMGPPIGTALYLDGGFWAPFLVAGVFVLAFAPVTLLMRQPAASVVMKCDGLPKEKAESLFDVLQPGLLVAAGSLFLGTAVFGIVEPILSLYLEEDVHMHPRSIGVVFAIFAFVYSLVGPAMGTLADRKGALRVSAAGNLVAGLSMALLLGPTARLFAAGTESRILYEVFALVVLGAAQAATLIPSLPAMKEGVTMDDDAENVTDRVVAWFNMFMQLGLALGPLAGTALVDTCGFEYAVAICGVVIAAYGVFATAYALKHPRCSEEIGVRRAHSITGITISPGSSPHAFDRMVGV